MRPLSLLRSLVLLPAFALLTGCNAVLLSPSGDVAVQQRDLIIISTVLMLLIIVPVIALTFLFAWRYRATNKDAPYDPEWDHSTQLELLIWAAPLLIIIALGAITWVSTHLLDPYRSLDRIDANRAKPADARPLVVEVVALDWKWLFLYPEQGIATVNELAAPVDREIRFKITSSTVMNAFFVPALAGMVYAMPGMETKLHAVINRKGAFDGISANYSGEGFSGMRFQFHGMDNAEFDRWVAQAKAGGQVLTRDAYLQLEQPSTREPVRHFASVAPGLYDAVLNRCVETNRMCMRDMMAIDAQGGQGKPGAYNVATLDPATRSRLGLDDAPVRSYVGGMCTPANPDGNAGATPASLPTLNPAGQSAAVTTPLLPLSRRAPDAVDQHV
jgi:cytochrome o ubiquinol oxidase subunit 2